MKFLYTSEYDSEKLRGKDVTERPWNLNDIIIANSQSQTKLLDIGCGTGFKLLPLFNHFSDITGLDISPSMIQASSKLINDKNIKNIFLIQGDSNQLPFPDSSFDIVTCMLSIWNDKEIIRVLKPGGSVIIEHVGCEDKLEFKLCFGQDENGWRGQFMDSKRDDFLQSFYNKFHPHLEILKIENGFWKTAYSKQGIFELLKFTPVIRGFDSVSDKNNIENACEKLKTVNGIELIQNRVLIHARKR